MNIQKTQTLIATIPTEVKLVAVTKNQTIDNIKTLTSFGINDFGENRLQELVKKKKLFPNNNWHFIGQIQSNKLRDIVKHSTLIHSVSELRYLEKINVEASKINKVQDVLLQLNLAEEKTKKGLPLADFYHVINNQHLYPNVSVKGLMVIGNHVDDTEKIKDTFNYAKQLFDNAQTTYPKFDTLSMGMSNDYKLAIDCGSTMLRIGSLLFEN